MSDEKDQGTPPHEESSGAASTTATTATTTANANANATTTANATANATTTATEPDDDAMRALLKRAHDADIDAPRTSRTNLLPGVQRKLRTRSKGKFYADGWSTSGSRINYALVAVAMLVVIAAAYLALGPTGISTR